MPGSKATNPIMLARQGFVAWDPLKYENAAIFEENQRIRMFWKIARVRSTQQSGINKVNNNKGLLENKGPFFEKRIV